MSRILPFLVSGLFTGACVTLMGEACAQSAQDDVATSAEASPLEDFFDRAVNDGLLIPNAASDVPAARADETHDSSDTHAAPTSRAFTCAQSTALDFTRFQELQKFDDIYRVRDGLSESEDMPESEAALIMAQATIALGLYSEGLAILGHARLPDELGLRDVATMMEARARPDVSRFRTHANCSEYGQVWLAIALGLNSDPEGAPLLMANMPMFRRLPLQLRIDATVQLMPRLKEIGEVTLAQRLLSTFSAEDVSGSTKLKYAQAVLRSGDDAPADDTRIAEFLINPQYRDDVIAALVQRQGPASPVYREIFTGNFRGQLGSGGRDEDVLPRVELLLEDFASDVRYHDILQLSVMPELQSRAVQHAIWTSFDQAIAEDFSSHDSMRIMAALQAVALSADMRNASPEQSQLLEQAMQHAVGMGLYALGEHFATLSGVDHLPVLARADLYMQRGDHDGVFALARANPANADLQMLAALAAIDAGESEELAWHAGSLTLDGATLVTLIERDAAVGGWIVPQHVYAIAETDVGDAYRARLDRAFALRHLQAGGTHRAISMSDAPGALARLRGELQPNSEGVH